MTSNSNHINGSSQSKGTQLEQMDIPIGLAKLVQNRITALNNRHRTGLFYERLYSIPLNLTRNGLLSFCVVTKDDTEQIEENICILHDNSYQENTKYGVIHNDTQLTTLASLLMRAAIIRFPDLDGVVIIKGDLLSINIYLYGNIFAINMLIVGNEDNKIIAYPLLVGCRKFENISVLNELFRVEISTICSQNQI